MRADQLFCIRVKELAERKGLSPADLAKQSGIRLKMIKQIIAGAHNTDLVSVQKIADVLGVHLTSLLVLPSSQ